MIARIMCGGSTRSTRPDDARPAICTRQDMTPTSDELR
jgi:hypothetical protein